jgi:hypothetical protein
MISFKKGEPKAVINGGKYDKKILYICDPSQKCCENCNESCQYEPCCDECKGGECGNNMIKNDVYDMIDEDYVRSLKKHMSRNDIQELNKSFRRQGLVDEDLKEIYEEVMNKNEDLSKREFKIWDNGQIQQIPKVNVTFRQYICGPAGSGKSYYISNLLKTMRKINPKIKIYIFSDLSEDPVLDSIGDIIRFKLDEGLIKKKPIDPKVVSNSICVFDDIDSIQNKKVLDAVEKLRDSLLRTGRHYNASVICSNHLCTNYKATRIILNECGAITIFPRSGSSDGIRYLLKKYAGLSKDQLDAIFQLPSRWVTIFKNADPVQYVIYEKGMYLL